jgi:Kef-type K+ transport system membrane component KefB
LHCLGKNIDTFSFLPTWPLQVDVIFIAALTLVSAALAGEGAFKFLGWPRIIGYSVTGMIAGAAGFGVNISATTRDNTPFGVVFDMGMALLLFEVGGRVSLSWLKDNPWLLATSIAEAALTFLAVAFLMLTMGYGATLAAATAIITLATSPAVVMRVTAEFKAQGQLSERLLLLAALNTVYAVIAQKFLIGWLHHQYGHNILAALLHPLYVFGGSALLAFLLAWAVARFESHIDFRDEHASLLVLGLLLLMIALLRTFELPVLLTPLLAGLWLRNRASRPLVWPRHFGSVGGVLVVLLFVVTGLSLSWSNLLAGGGIAIAIVAVRAVAKIGVLLVLGAPSGLSMQQSFALGVALCPMSGVAFALVTETADRFPELGLSLGAIVLSTIAILEILGPLAVRWSLSRSGEIHR